MSSLPAQRFFYPFLLPLGKAYASLMRKRRAAYESGKKERFEPTVPCIAVGNIGWGGSGKTPIVDWLLTWAEKQNLKPAVLTRGYKASPPALPYQVSTSSTPATAGDEPCMLARNHPKASVIVDPVRKRSGAWAEQRLTPDLFILDDGFQHLAVKRHADFVLLKMQDLQDEWNRVIPSGSWREDAETLSRATGFFIKVPDVNALKTEYQPDWYSALDKAVQTRLAQFGKPVFPFSIVPTKLIPAFPSPQNALSAPSLHNKPYVLMTGVGDPNQVCETMTRFIGHAPQHHAIFPDHHAYTTDDVVSLAGHGLPLVCTPKDAVKLPAQELIRAGVECWTMELSVQFGHPWFSQIDFPKWWDIIWREMQNIPDRTSP